MARTEALALVRGGQAATWWRSNATALLFMMPAAILVLVFFFVPVLLTIGMGFTNIATATGLAGWQWIGTANYEQIFRGAFTGLIARNTLVYVVLTLSFNVIVGLTVALLSVHMADRAGGAFRALWLLPRISPSVVYVLMWTWAVSPPPFGIINQLVAPLGVAPRFWMNTDPWPVVIFVNGFVGASLGMLVFASAIESIPEDLFRAARVDGANAWHILLTTNGGPGLYLTEVWSLWAFHTALQSYFGNLEIGLGAAMAAILVLVGLIVSALLLRLFRFNDLVAEPRVEIT